MGSNWTQDLQVAIERWMQSPKFPTSTALWHVVQSGSNCQKRQISRERERVALKVIALRALDVRSPRCSLYFYERWRSAVSISIHSSYNDCINPHSHHSTVVTITASIPIWSPWLDEFSSTKILVWRNDCCCRCWINPVLVTRVESIIFKMNPLLKKQFIWHGLYNITKDTPKSNIKSRILKDISAMVCRIFSVIVFK